MRKLFFMAAALVAAQTVTGAARPEAADTTNRVVVMRPDSVVMETCGDRFGVTVHGTQGNPQFSYSRQMRINTGEPVVEREHKHDWDFNMPFSNKRSGRKGRAHHSWGMSGPTFGFVRTLDAPAEMNTRWGSSFEFTWPAILDYTYHTRGDHFLFSAGFGIGWRNFRMKGRTRFLKDGDRLVLGEYPEGAEIRFSRLKEFRLMMPFTATYTTDHDLRFSLGPVLNFNTFANIKTRYKLDGRKIKEKEGNLHQLPVTVDIMAVLHFKGVGFYTKYSPCKVLESDFGPEFSALSMGVALFY